MLRCECELAAASKCERSIGGNSFQAQNDPRLLFGLGQAAVEQVEIRWPSGRRQVLSSLPTGRYVEVMEQP